MRWTEFKIREYGPHSRYAKVGNTTMRANTRTGKVSANSKVGNLDLYVDNTLNKDGSQGRGTATYTKDKLKIKHDTRKGALVSYKNADGTTMSASDDGKGNKKFKVSEDGRIVKGVNTTADVGVNQISIEAGKLGFKVDKDGKPPTLSKKVKGKSTNVLFNLGLAEGIEDKLGEIAQSTEIYIDMDGVLADFFGAWEQLMDVEHWADINKKDSFAGGLEKIRNSNDFWLELPILPQATQLLNLVRNIKGEYNICSSPLADDPNSEPHKHEWIKKNLSFFPPKNVYITHNKEQFATQEDGTPNILIDDFGKNIKKWEDAGGYGFKYKDHKFERTAAQIKQHMQEPVEEKAPPGREKQVKALKGKVDNPYAVAWASYNKSKKKKSG